MPVVAEFRKRNVFRVGAAYLVAAWLIVQVAETLFPLFGFGDAPARIVVILLAIGFVPALVLAWAFRITPDGLRRESEIDAPLSAQAGKRLDRMIMVVLALALSVFAVDRFVLDPQREADSRAELASRLEEARLRGRTEALIESYGDRSIAVLPFANMSDDPGNEYFADGVAEEVLNLLARIPGLRVISRSSAFSYKGKDVRLDQVANELRVAYVLEGSVRKSGDTVRITAQLIDARADAHVWSETFDRRLDDIFAIQEEIAAVVTERLRPSLVGNAPRPRLTDPEAYAQFLEARALARLGGADDYTRAEALLNQVIAADPEYVDAWDALAGIYVNQAGKGLKPADEGFRQAVDAARRALAIEPDYGPAHARLGWVALLHEHDLALAARHYQSALQRAPNSMRIIGDSTSVLRALGRSDDCVRVDEFVVSRDPVNPVSHFNLGVCYLSAGRYAEAIATLRTSLRLGPNRVGGQYQLGVAELLSGNPSAALESFDREPLAVLKLIGQAMALHALGDDASADRLQHELITQFERDAAYNIAYVLAYRGQVDAAFEWLQRAAAYGDPGLADIIAEPLFANLHRDPRWPAFLESVGRAPSQLQEISFEVNLPRA